MLVLVLKKGCLVWGPHHLLLQSKNLELDSSPHHEHWCCFSSSLFVKWPINNLMHCHPHLRLGSDTFLLWWWLLLYHWIVCVYVKYQHIQCHQPSSSSKSSSSQHHHGTMLQAYLPSLRTPMQLSPSFKHNLARNLYHEVRHENTHTHRVARFFGSHVTQHWWKNNFICIPMEASVSKK